MTPDQREAVLANAKYLRGRRPVDPEEVSEYVEGGPHPAAVRQVIRESAVTLGLVEREDGSFVPASEEPVASRRGPVEALPDDHASRLEERLVERFGPTWWDGDSGDRLRSILRRVKEDYYRGRPVDYDADVALAYAIYHLPDFYAAVQYVVEDLVDRGLVSRRLRVLDVGAGVGGPALGLVDRLPADALVEYHGVEPSAAADVLEAMLGDLGPNVHATVHRQRAESFDPEGEYDLLVFANVLSELEAPVEVIERYVGHLAPDGALLLLAPADRETSVGLRHVERSLVDGLGVYSPTVRLWPGVEPTDRGWSFDVRPELAVPRFQARLDEAGGAAGEFVNVDVQFAYAILRADGARRVAVDLDPGRFARFADSEEHVTDRVDCAAVKLSRDLAEGANPLFKVGDGSERVDHFAVLVDETTLNRDLVESDYADLLVMESALVLWNDDEAAYNLVVDAETVVDRAGP